MRQALQEAAAARATDTSSGRDGAFEPADAPSFERAFTEMNAEVEAAAEPCARHPTPCTLHSARHWPLALRWQ